jgi:phosphoglycerate dehydrogenase-like enzyme
MRSGTRDIRRKVSLEDLLRRADIVTLQMVLADSTRAMIGARELALLRPTALLVNTSRGPLIDARALVQALTERRIAGAALDVYSEADDQRNQESGFDHYFVKPVSLEKITELFKMVGPSGT